jgi:hypothetical protein
LSSAILYLAIVAIWAFLLIPRLVRRSHVTSFAGGDAAGIETELTPVGSAELAGLADSDAGSTPGDLDAPGDPGAPRPGILRAVGLVGPRHTPVEWQAREAQWQAREAQAQETQGQARDQEPAEDQPEPDTAPLAPIRLPSPEPQPAAGTAPAGPSGSPASPSAPTARSPAPSSSVPSPSRPARPPLGRAKILQARRRLLTTLVVLAIAAASCTALKLTSAWVCVPPAGMLGLYLLLLRETALADAEQARWQAAHARQAHAARQLARAESRQAWAARTPQPTAEIIDISARLGDQLYDQYADATVRAVGD